MRISIILPCRNEAEHLDHCLESILASEWPRHALEVLVVDGASDDGSATVAARYAQQYPQVRVLHNPARTAPAAMNVGLAQASGDVIVRMDAHVRYPPDYVPRLVQLLLDSGAWNVGGRIETLPANDSPMARAIARAISHPFGVGNAHFRLHGTTQRWVDTVPFGCWRRATFREIGGFDESLVRNQDDELNARILKHGGRILLDPSVVSEYIARARLSQLARMYFQYGLFKPLAARKVGGVVTLRQLVPLAAVLTLLCGLVLGALWPPVLAPLGGLIALYAALAVGCALHAAHRDGPAVVFLLAVSFAVVHASYGLGFLRGLLRLGLDPVGRHHATSLPLSR